MWRRVPWKVWIGIGLILIGAAIFGGWRWWIATRTWVPLEMPISLAKGHIRSPEFKINVKSSFWIWVAVKTQVDDAAVSCWIGYESEYCQKNSVHEMRANWTLSDSGRILAQGDANRYRGAFYPERYRARGLGSFDAHAGDHYVLDVDITEDFSRFDAFHPRLAIVSSDYWRFDDEQSWVFVISTLLVAAGVAPVVYTIGAWIHRGNDYQSFSFTFPGPLPGGLGTEAGPPIVKNPGSRRSGLPGWAWIGLAAVLGGVCGYVEIPLQWTVAVAIVGATPFVLGWMVRFAPRSKTLTLGLSPNHSQNIQWAQRLPLRRPITGIPRFGLIGGAVFAILAILMMMLTASFYRTSTGDRVDLLKPGEVPAKSDAWTEPLIVRVKDDGAGREPKLLVNSRKLYGTTSTGR
jgi:hypothetical protein